MTMVWRIIRESTAQAFSQLTSNKLRTFLSLLGITIGIFCIIGVFSAVDSLENNVRSSFDRLGEDVVYVSKISWNEDPGRSFFKYLRRPPVRYQDYEAVKAKSKLAAGVTYSTGIGSRTAKYRSNSAERTYLFAVTYDYQQVQSLEIAKGRFFSPSEYRFGSNKIILGADVAETLFPGNIDPIGKTIKVSGRALQVIGVLAKSGESIIDIMNLDPVLLISYELARKMANLNNNNAIFDNTNVAVKALPGVPLEYLKDELRGILRSRHRLKPTADDDFSLNQLSILTNLLDGFFRVLNILGVFIGGFATLVGMFSVANIMFVTVKERTRIIGIKKALGAKSGHILLEFLIESIVLCILGGLLGLMLILVSLALISKAFTSFEFVLSLHNVVLGVSLSIAIGVIAGMVPALQAARMDPVEAMRR
ncbi:MAG: ABC transporter permease [Saprospiraceae bacterium]